MEILCKELTDTYNTNVLDKSDKDIREEFMKVSSEFRDSGEGKSVLMNLIYNHFSPDVQKPEPLYIGGPKNLTVHWSERYKKIIYIFGEHHSPLLDCFRFGQKTSDMEWDVPGAKIMSIEYFFKELSRTTDSFIDFLFEIPATEIKSKGYHEDFDPYADEYKNFRLSKLFDDFKGCINYQTRSEKRCRLSRVHYFDSRFNDKGSALKGSNILSAFRIEIQNIRKYVEKESQAAAVKKLLQEKPVFLKMFEYLGNRDDRIILRFLISQSKQNTYAHKELGRFEEGNSIRLLINEFIQEENKIYMDTYKLLWKTHSKTILKFIKQSDKGSGSQTIEDFEKSFTYIYESLIGVNSIVSDVYLLSRLFKNFDLSKMEEKAYTGATDQPANATNVIIYAGSSKSDKYRLFLKNKLGFKQIAETGNPKEADMHCIDMSTIPQPFFKSWPPNEYIEKLPVLVSQQSPVVVGPDIPDDCNKNIVWKTDKYLTHGEQATVCSSPTVHEGYYTYVVKSQVANINFFKEVNALKELKDTKLVVKMFDAWTCNRNGYIAMECVRPFGYNSTYDITQLALWKEVGIILSRLSERGWLQIDVHAQNVAITKDGKIVLIDFGVAVKKTEGVGQTYPEHLYSLTYPDITWEQLKILQDFNYQKAFNPQTTDEQKTIFQEAKERWESQTFGKFIPGRRRAYFDNLKRALTAQ